MPQDDVRACRYTTVPNTVIVAVGDMWPHARLSVIVAARDVRDILRKKGYKVVFYDYSKKPFGKKELNENAEATPIPRQPQKGQDIAEPI